jgi:hypothetical protein
MDKTFGTSKGMKVGCWVLAVLCAVFIVTLPGTLLMLWIAYGAHVRMTGDKLYIRWIGSREIPWSDVSGFAWAGGAGAVRAALRPLKCQLHSKPGSNANTIAVGAFERSDEMLAELTRRTGQPIPQWRESPAIEPGSRRV